MRIFIDDRLGVLTCKISDAEDSAGNVKKGTVYYNCDSKTRIKAKKLLVKVTQSL